MNLAVDPKIMKTPTTMMIQAIQARAMTLTASSKNIPTKNLKSAQARDLGQGLLSRKRTH